MKSKEVIARYTYKGKKFEIPILWEKYSLWKKGKLDDLSEVVIGDSIFSDVRKALRAKEQDIHDVFGDKDFYEMCRIILEKGEIQLTEEQRKELQEEKHKRIVSFIVANAIDARTSTPLTPTRVEHALEQAKFRVKPLEPVEKQIEEAIKALRPIIPIKLERKHYVVKVPLEYGGKARHELMRFSTIKHEDWSSTYYVCEVEIPAGLMNELFSALNKVTKGEVLIEEKKR
ncbi:MAG: ribosome assembly factor SBDS [Candidatus Nanohaloarchaeota archaeon]|nr:ribosome assembly factor SBDS [Candidatus Nanohaloarchaeota archaeon]